MSKRRKPGDIVRLLPNTGFVGESDRLSASIQPEDNPPPCYMCDDPECVEWSNLLTVPDPDNDDIQYGLCHVSECRMLDLKED